MVKSSEAKSIIYGKLRNSYGEMLGTKANGKRYIKHANTLIIQNFASLLPNINFERLKPPYKNLILVRDKKRSLF